MPRPIRVHVAMSTLGEGGIPAGTLSLLRNLDREKLVPSLFLHMAPFSDARPVPEDVPVSWAFQRNYRRRKLPTIIAKQIAAARGHDVILAASEGRTLLAAFIAGKVLGIPVVSWIRYDWSAHEHFARPRQFTALRRILPRVHMTVACGENTGTSIRRLCHLPEQRVRVIRNYIDLDLVIAQGKEALAQEAEAIFAKPVVVGVGRLEREKGFERLIRAHQQVKHAGVDHHLLIVGEGSKRAELEQQAQDLGVGDTVFMPGHYRNPFAWMARSQVFALSSHAEGFGRVLVEALGLRLPAVSFRCPSGPAEILEHAQHGRLVGPEDEAGFADAIGELLSDEITREDLAARSYDRAWYYDREAVLPAWTHLFEEVAGAKR